MALRIFIGYDHKEPIAYHVLSHSILKRASIPVQITPLYRPNIKDQFWRPRGEYDSTDFSNSRFIVPHLCDFDGQAIFMDCDMLCLSDIAELASQFDPRYAVKVKQHNYETKQDVKFLGQRNDPYQRKNWSSLILFNNDLCRPLTRHIVNTITPGFWLHKFEWLEDDMIGGISGAWNHLVGEYPENPNAKLPHFTLGGPWHGFDCEFADEWHSELEDLMQGDNPVDWRNAKTNKFRQA